MKEQITFNKLFKKNFEEFLWNKNCWALLKYSLQAFCVSFLVGFFNLMF